MKIKEWAKREVELAKRRERDGGPIEWDYECACYDSAYVDRFPTDTELYRAMTTKPEEVSEA